MIFLDKPFVSEYVQQSIVDQGISVVHTAVTTELNLRSDLIMISEEEALERIRINPSELLYSNSENAINWISQNLSFSSIPEQINLFKDKVRFRELIRPLYPEYYFRSLEWDQFEDMENASLIYPLILKPAVGFFSMGVYKLRCKEDWQPVKKKIQEELSRVGHLYPVEVFNSSKFILEACIPGREFAMDAYFDASGNPVILFIN